MIALSKVRSYLWFFGLTSQHPENSNLVLLRWFAAVTPMLAIISAGTMYFMANMKDVVKATDAVYVVTAKQLAIGVILYLFWKRTIIEKILQNLQNIVAESKLEMTHCLS